MSKRKHKPFYRVLTVILALTMVMPALLGAAPAGATENMGGEITAFAPLGENIEK